MPKKIPAHRCGASRVSKGPRPSGPSNTFGALSATGDVKARSFEQRLIAEIDGQSRESGEQKAADAERDAWPKLVWLLETI